MDWLRRLWNVVTRVVLPVVTAVQRVVQQVRTATAQQPGTPPEAVAATRAAQEAAAARTHQQQAQQQGAARFDRDISQRADGPPFPAITPAEKRAMRELLASPTNRSLHLLVEPDADVVLKIARQVPGILETAVQLRGTLKGAFDYLLADGVSLSEEDLYELLGTNVTADDHFSNRGQAFTSRCPAFLYGMEGVTKEGLLYAIRGGGLAYDLDPRKRTMIIENVGPVDVYGEIIDTSHGPLFIAGSFTAEDPDRRAGGDVGIYQYHAGFYEAFQPYLDLVVNNKAAFLEVANRRLTELKVILIGVTQLNEGESAAEHDRDGRPRG